MVHSTVKLSFHGAAGCVTGSKYLIEHEGRRVLVDCGLFQGEKELRLRNWEEPSFDPQDISAVVLTHAHIDHTGYLPLIVKRGFKGPVFCTSATREFLSLLLPDTAHLQEEEAAWANKKGTSKHKPAKPLYDEHDARRTLTYLRPLERRGTTEVLPGVAVTARIAGHILGAVSLAVEVSGKLITFSGDIGRYDVPILPDPQPVPLGDMLLCESTYGNTEHAQADSKKELARVIKLAVERKGPLIIPAFALGRTQMLLYYIAELEREGKIPILPVFVDSPMAIDATSIYRNHNYDYDEEAAELVKNGRSPIRTERTAFCRSADESKRLNLMSGPRIIIAASGMVTGGRILHHMANWLPVPETTVLLVGYQAAGSRGRTIQSGAPEVKIFGRYIPIRARVETISGLSAHGDRSELLRWLGSSDGTPKSVRIVHGEPQSAKEFSETLNRKFGWDARPAEHLETVEI